MANIVDIANDIGQQVDIVDIISRYIKVTKKGRDFVALCPFHDDHHESMHISPEKKIFKCFSCNTSGNVFSFVKKYEKCSFYEAVKKVAELAGINDPRLEHVTEKRVEINPNLVPLYDCLEDLSKFYGYCINSAEGKIAKDYLHSRDITDEQIARYQLGYSLSDGTKTVNYLQSKNYSLKTIEDIGIAHARSVGTSDMNAGRLIFPIHDLNNRVIGFSARRLSDNKDEAKFINSPGTALYHKSNVLYNLYNAATEAKRSGYVYIVEGFMDVFALDSIGIPSVIALMGTSFTKEHVEILRRLNVEIRLCLDGDDPGQNAMMKTIPMLDKAGLKYRLVYQEGNILDPDEILRQKGSDALKQYVNTLVDSFTFVTNYYLRTNSLQSPEDRKKIVKHFMDLLVNEKDPFLYEDYVAKLARITKFEPHVIKKAVIAQRNKGKLVDETNTELVFPRHQKQLKRLALAEKELLTQMLAHEEAIKFYTTRVESFVDNTYRAIADYLADYYDQHARIDINGLISSLENSTLTDKDDVINTVTELYDGINPKMAFKEKVLDDCLKVINEEKTKDFNKRTLDETLLGKSEEDKARIIQDYIQEKNKKNTKK